MEITTPVHYQVVHDTTYDYSNTVSSGQHFSHLSPRNTLSQKVLSHTLICNPAPEEQSKIIDYFGNETHSFLITESHEQFLVSAISKVDVSTVLHDPQLLAQNWNLALEQAPNAYELSEIAEMRLPSPHVECLAQSENYSRRFFTAGRSWIEAMLDLTTAIREEFSYTPDSTTIYTPVSEVFTNKEGVCQDFAHLMLSCLRSIRLPARYVSGYILNEPPPGEIKLIGSDASHAWIESWLPGVGWIGFDPTNGKMVTDEFIVAAWGRDFMDVTPLRGVVLGGGSHELTVSVTMNRIEAPADLSTQAQTS